MAKELAILQQWTEEDCLVIENQRDMIRRVQAFKDKIDDRFKALNLEHDAIRHLQDDLSKQNLEQAIRILSIKVKKLMPRALAIQTKLKKIQKAGLEMEGNETDDEGEFIDVLQAEMPAVLKEMEECIVSIEDCERMLEELKQKKTVELMKKLQEEANTAEKMLEHKESLSGKLEPELIQWDP